MTLEQTTLRILQAAEAQDLEGLERASNDRESAIGMLPSMPPTQALCDAVAASIEAGEEAGRTIRLIRHRMRNQSRRLERIDSEFLRVLLPAASHQVDCQG